MKGAALLAILLWQAAAANEPPVAQPGAMQYERAIRVAGGGRGTGLRGAGRGDLRPRRALADRPADLSGAGGGCGRGGA